MWAKLDVLDSLGRTIYHEPEPPPRTRNPSKPMEVICAGFPRTGTESLQTALLTLGYDYTYHGWDVIFEQPHYMSAWCQLARKKWYGSNNGESNISRSDFEAILGHCVAVTDAAASVFAAEMIAAYPEAKVVLNVRRDEDAWHRSVVKNLCGAANDSWSIYLQSWLSSTGFWSWMVYERYLWPLLFRATDAGETALGKAVRRNGKWVMREHCAMVRGLVPKQRLLDWEVEDGWEPLCEVTAAYSIKFYERRELIEVQFLGKEVPSEEFPRTNDAAGFAERGQQWFMVNKRKMRRNITMLSACLIAGVALVAWRLARSAA